MELAHRDVLRRNRTNILNDLHNLKEVVDDLYGNGLLTDGMKEEILLGSNLPKSRIRNLLDILPKRGNRAFQLFCTALDNTHNEHIVDYWNPQRERRKLDSPGSSLSSQQREIHVQPSAEQSYVPVVPSGSGDSTEKYSKCVKKNGLMLIINNINDPDANSGRDSDFMAVSTLFKNDFNFDVISKSKRTAMQVENLLCAQKQSLNKSSGDYNCFVLLFMSTGTPKTAYGFDKVAIDTNEIVQHFTDESCPSLANKPKIFIFQTCPPLKPENAEDEKEILCKFKSLCLEDKSKNIFIITAIPEPEFGSWKKNTTENGSWFIQTLVQVFKREKTITIRKLVKELKRSLSNVQWENRMVNMASVELYDSLTDDVSFFPEDKVNTPPCSHGPNHHISYAAAAPGRLVMGERDYVNMSISKLYSSGMPVSHVSEEAPGINKAWPYNVGSTVTQQQISSFRREVGVTAARCNGNSRDVYQNVYQNFP